MELKSDMPTTMMEIMERVEPVIYIIMACMGRFFAGAWAMLMATFGRATTSKEIVGKP